MSGPLAVATARSQNRKIGAAAVTYAAQASCPDDCAFLNAGCYAEGATLGMLTRRLNANAAEASALDVALEEAAAIDAISPAYHGQPMRLHTVGDCATEASARIVSSAAARWVARGGGDVWTYTHAWRVVPREAWGEVRVLASCETPLDVPLAHERGYATAIVVDDFPGDRLYHLDGQPVIPCPAQTRGVPCTDCRLCFGADRLRDTGTTIGFSIHGDNATVRQARGVLSGKRPVKLREVVPEYVAQGFTDAQIARLTGTSSSSVWEMRTRLIAEGVIA